jgi:hypothetical protein
MESKAKKDMLNLRIEATSACPASAGVFGHPTSQAKNLK